MNISSINGIETKNIQRINKIYTSQIKSVCGAEISMKPFKTLWSVGAGQSITLPLVNGYSYDCTVDWGDETSNYIDSYDSANRIHTYSSVGEYVVSIKGICEGWNFQTVNTSRLLITKVLDFGEVEFKRLNFFECSNLNEINGQINGPDITNFSNCFYNNNLDSIPAGLFDKCTQVKSFSLCFYSNNLTSIPDGLFDNCPLVTDFTNCFMSNNLTSIPAGLFDNNTLVTNFSLCFYDNNLTSIPIGLFDNCIKVIEFSYCFYNNQLTSIPENLFDNNTLVTNFIWCFYSNNLTSIPIGLFDKCTQVTNFFSCFGVNQLTSIPIGLFDKCTQVKSFDNCFYDNNLTSIPIGLFDKCTQVTNFSLCFYDNNLTSIPAGLFDKCTQVTNFSYCFSSNQKLKLNKYIFYSEGQQSTRFLNQSVNFGNCFYRDSYVSPDAENGEAPDLWNCDFGTGTPTKDGCFSGNGNNAITLTNYASIPSEWK